MTELKKSFDRERAKKLLESGMSYRDVASEVGVSRSHLYRSIPSSRKPGGTRVEFDEDLARELLDSGAKYSDVAKRLGIHKSTLGARIPGTGYKKYLEGLEGALRAAFAKGMSDEEIARELGVSKGSVLNMRRKFNLNRIENPIPRMSDEELARARSLLEEGYSIPQVSEIIGRGSEALRKRFPEFVLSRKEVGERAMLARWGERILGNL